MEYESLKREYESLKREFYASRPYFDNTSDNMNDVWHFERASSIEREMTGAHETVKPISLCTRAIKASSKKGDSIFDVFGGSGSALIACEQNGRTAYCMEIDPKYCQVIIDRWEALTGEKAVLADE